MKTIDTMVGTVGTYNGDLKNGAAKYERAKKNLEIIKTAQAKLESNLKQNAGFSEHHTPDEAFTDEIRRGDVTFKIKTHRVNQRPQYSTAVKNMENYVLSTEHLASNGHTISGVTKKDDKFYISADRLLGQFELFVEEMKKPGLRQSIRYEDNSAEKRVKSFDLEKMTSGLTENNFNAYVTIDGIRKGLENYVNTFEDVLLSKGDFVKISKNKVYKLEDEVRQGSDWGYIVKTLILGDKDEEGELSVLADKSVSFAKKKRDLPFYDMQLRNVRGEKKVYVSLESVRNRIEDLKEEKR